MLPIEEVTDHRGGIVLHFLQHFLDGFVVGLPGLLPGDIEIANHPGVLLAPVLYRPAFAVILPELPGIVTPVLE